MSAIRSERSSRFWSRSMEADSVSSNEKHHLSFLFSIFLYIEHNLPWNIYWVKIQIQRTFLKSWRRSEAHSARNAIFTIGSNPNIVSFPTSLSSDADIPSKDFHREKNGTVYYNRAVMARDRGLLSWRAQTSLQKPYFANILCSKRCIFWDV